MARQVRLSQWAGIMHERSESGKSIRKWCAENGIQEKTYYYWQRNLRESACSLIEQKGAAVTPAGWALCETAGSGKSEEPITIEINGCRLLVGGSFEPEALKNVCRILKSL